MGVSGAEELSRVEENLVPDSPRLVGGFRRALYVGLGLFFVFLGLLGAFLPILPTTPFLLLASFFFVRSSPALNRWLLRSKLFGPLLRDWQQHRGVRRPVKVLAVLVLCSAVLASVLLAELSWPLLALLGALALVGLVVVLRLPVVERAPERSIAERPGAGG